MRFDDDRLRKLMTYRFKPGTASPRPKHHHLHEFREKEFNDGNIAELFHENTKYGENSHVLDVSSVSLFVGDETMQLVQLERQNDYPGRETVDFPDPERDLGIDLGEALARRRSRRAYDGSAISRQELSTLLGTALGVNGLLSTDVARTMARTYPSGGGLYPVETYLAVINGGPELESGLYYYVAEDHALRVLGGDVTDVIDRAFKPPETLDPRDSAVCLLFTGAFWRTYAKYGPRGYRFVLQESGHIGQNVQLVADALGFGSLPIAAVHDREIEDLLDINGVDEGLVYAMFVGSPQRVDGDGRSQADSDERPRTDPDEQPGRVGGSRHE